MKYDEVTQEFMACEHSWWCKKMPKESKRLTLRVLFPVFVSWQCKPWLHLQMHSRRECNTLVILVIWTKALQIACLQHSPTRSRRPTDESTIKLSNCTSSYGCLSISVFSSFSQTWMWAQTLSERGKNMAFQRVGNMTSKMKRSCQWSQSGFWVDRTVLHLALKALRKHSKTVQVSLSLEASLRCWTRYTRRACSTLRPWVHVCLKL